MPITKKSGRKFTKSRKEFEDAIERARRYRELVNQEYNIIKNGLTFITNDKEGIKEILVKAIEKEGASKNLLTYKKEISKLFEEKYGRKPNMNYMEVQLGSIINRIDSLFIEILFNLNLRKSEIQEILNISEDDRIKPFHKWTKFTFENFDYDKYIEEIVKKAEKDYKVKIDMEELTKILENPKKKFENIKKVYDEDINAIKKVEDLNDLTGFLV